MIKIGLQFSVFLFLFFAHNSNAQDIEKANSEEIKSEDSSTAFISEGTVGQAKRRSAKFGLLVIHISGGTQDKYTADQYAKIFRVMFNDPKRTKFPTEIFVMYSESGRDRPTGLYAFLNGSTFDKNSGGYFDGDGVFSAIEIVQWIPMITKQFAVMEHH